MEHAPNMLACIPSDLFPNPI